jgi:hypothetical protein
VSVLTSRTRKPLKNMEVTAERYLGNRYSIRLSYGAGANLPHYLTPFPNGHNRNSSNGVVAILGHAFFQWLCVSSSRARFSSSTLTLASPSSPRSL